MFDNEFDELFRSRLKDHPSAVPEGMWQRIVGKTEGRRDVGAWWWYVTGAVVLIAGVLFREHASPSSDGKPAVIAPGKSYATLSANPVIPGHADLPTGRSHTAAPARPVTPEPAVPYADGSAAPKPAGIAAQTHSVSEPAILRSGFGPRSQSGPGFFSITGGAGHWLPNREPFSLAFSSPYANHPAGKPIPCPDPANLNGNSGWFPEAYFSPDFPYNSHRQGFSYSAGGRLGKTINDRFFVTVGLEYSHIAPQASKDSIPGQPFNNIDLPVLLGYRIGSAKNTFVHAGLIWNLYSRPGGGDNGIPYTSHTGLAFYLGLGFLQPLDSRWSVFVESHFRYQLSDRSANLVQSPDLGGVSFGVRYNLKGRGGAR